MSVILREEHGVIDARKLSVAGYTDRQSVRIANDGPWVRLDLGTSSYPAGLTPAQARYLAGHLMAAANRAERSS